MKLIIGGSIAIILSIVGFAYSFPEFLKFLAGSIPIMLLLGGCLALYLYREMRCEECDDTAEPESTWTGDSHADADGSPEPDPVPGTPAPQPEEKIDTPDMKTAQAETSAAALHDGSAPAPGKEAPTVEETPPETAVEGAPAGETAEAEPSEAPAAQAAPEAGKTVGGGTANAAGPEESGVVGNEESKVFHRLDCQYAKSKKCTASFATAGEALEAGYKACGVCKPTG